MKGLDLNERYYREAVRPVLDTHFPDLAHSAALIGWSSEVQGFDDDTSTDHNWGPRFWLFLSSEDAKKYSDEVDKCLSDNLPAEFLGYPTAFDYIEQRGERKYHRHNINIDTVAEYFKQYLGADLRDRTLAGGLAYLSAAQITGVTNGRVFYDGLGELERARDLLAYYPREKLAGAYSLVIRRFNGLGIVEPMSEEVSLYFSRQMLTIQDESAVKNLLGAIEDERVRNIGHSRFGQPGIGS
jgi:hypothetical protein